jgi:hypothetical protein
MAQVNLKRLIWACSATVVSISIFLIKYHRHIDVSHPEALLSSLGNVCGILMLACVAWVWIELALLLLSPSQSDSRGNDGDLLS